MSKFLFQGEGKLPGAWSEYFRARFQTSKPLPAREAGFEEKKRRVCYVLLMKAGRVACAEDWIALRRDGSDRGAVDFDHEEELKTLMRITLDAFLVLSIRRFRNLLCRRVSP